MVQLRDKAIVLKQLGIIHSPYKGRRDAPRQGRYSDTISEIEIFPDFKEGLDNIEHCTYLIVLWWADRAERDLLKVIPPNETEERGVFSTRSPARPNPIGFSVVKLKDRKENRLKVQWLDAIDQTPLIDIKSYSPGIDIVEDIEET